MHNIIHYNNNIYRGNADASRVKRVVRRLACRDYGLKRGFVEDDFGLTTFAERTTKPALAPFLLGMSTNGPTRLVSLGITRGGSKRNDLTRWPCCLSWNWWPVEAWVISASNALVVCVMSFFRDGLALACTNRVCMLTISVDRAAFTAWVCRLLPLITSTSVRSSCVYGCAGLAVMWNRVDSLAIVIPVQRRIGLLTTVGHSITWAVAIPIIIVAAAVAALIVIATNLGAANVRES